MGTVNEVTAKQLDKEIPPWKKESWDSLNDEEKEQVVKEWVNDIIE